jgi:hypothetical protein
MPPALSHGKAGDDLDLRLAEFGVPLFEAMPTAPRTPSDGATDSGVEGAPRFDVDPACG